MRGHLKPARGLLGGLLMALFLVTTAVGYEGQIEATIIGSGPAGPQACNTPITVTALLEDINGVPVDDREVTWSFVSGNIAGDEILDTTTTTDANGVATTRVRFACSARSVTIGAVAGLASGNFVIVLSGAGLPRTDTSTGPALPTMVLAALAVLIGAATILRRFATQGR